MLSSHDPVRVKTEKLSTSPPTTAIGRLRLRSRQAEPLRRLSTGPRCCRRLPLGVRASRAHGGTDAPLVREGRSPRPTPTATSTATAAARGRHPVPRGRLRVHPEPAGAPTAKMTGAPAARTARCGDQTPRNPIRRRTTTGSASHRTEAAALYAISGSCRPGSSPAAASDGRWHRCAQGLHLLQSAGRLALHGRDRATTGFDGFSREGDPVPIRLEAVDEPLPTGS